MSQDPAQLGLTAVVGVMAFLAVSALLLALSFRSGRFGSRRPEVDRSGLGTTETLPDFRAARPPRSTAGSWRARPSRWTPEQLDGYSASMQRLLRTLSVTVVREAHVHEGERILHARIAIARDGPNSVPTVRVSEAASAVQVIANHNPSTQLLAAAAADLPFPPGWFQVVVSVHALQLADDPVSFLTEWRRVTSPGGRLSLSMPGLLVARDGTVYDPVYRRHRVKRLLTLATRSKLTQWARAAGWRHVHVTGEPTSVELAGPQEFSRWLRSGLPPDLSRALDAERLAELEGDLFAATPTGKSERLEIPFASLFLTARNP